MYKTGIIYHWVVFFLTYVSSILDIIKRQSQGTPIYTNEIAEVLAAQFSISKKKAAAATAVAVKRIMDSGFLPDLRCYQKGIYFRTVVTPFGETGISREKLIADKYLLPDCGYETGLGLLHHLGLTTQVPAERVLATNAAKNCTRRDKKLGVAVCPPKTKITAENRAYLQILDAIEFMDKAPVDVQNPYTILADHIRKNGLQYEMLLYYADQYYNRKTIIRLAHTANS